MLIRGIFTNTKFSSIGWIQIIRNPLKNYLMTETLKDISKQIADLLVKQNEIQDTILKA